MRNFGYLKLFRLKGYICKLLYIVRSDSITSIMGLLRNSCRFLVDDLLLQTNKNC